MPNVTYVLKKNIQTRYQHKYDIDRLRCSLCGEPLELDEEIAVQRKNGSNPRFFCVKCSNSRYIDLQD